MQILPVYFDCSQKYLVQSVEGIIASPSERPLDPRDTSFWMHFGRNWSAQCFDCHASQIAVNTIPMRVLMIPLGRFEYQLRDLPRSGQGHVAFWGESADRCRCCRYAGYFAGEFENAFLRTIRRALRAVPRDEAHFELGYRPGDNFYDFYEPVVLDFEGMWPMVATDISRIIIRRSRSVPVIQRAG